MEQIENLRRRVKELESLINQPQQSSSRERDSRAHVESINPCFTHQDGDRGSDELNENGHSPREEPANGDIDAESIETPPHGQR
jgi:hypothetical protein